MGECVGCCLTLLDHVISRHPMKILATCALTIRCGYVEACSYIESSRSAAHQPVHTRNTKQSVKSKFKAEPIVERADGESFSRYASSKCTECTERLWFENRLTLDTRAWSVDIDETGTVISKAEWTSP